jgi:hypothetical protein
MNADLCTVCGQDCAERLRQQDCAERLRQQEEDDARLRDLQDTLQVEPTDSPDDWEVW